MGKRLDKPPGNLVPAERCSFCGRDSRQTGRIISGSEANICSECIEYCNQLLREERSQQLLGNFQTLPRPTEIKAFLDDFVIGQEAAKITLSVAVYNHYKRIIHQDRLGEEVEVDKSNILLIGPTGTGKTLLAQTLARLLRVPFAIADATVLTEAGYVGEDVENILVRLLQASNYEVSKAEQGIVYVDELDKIARKDGNPSITRDVSGEGVQQALLKILEGTVAHVPPKGGRKHPEAPMVAINTRNILFIAGGAFIGLETIIQKRLGHNVVGFGHEPQVAPHHRLQEVLVKVEPEDLLQFGLIPELIGRLPVVVPLTPLDAPALRAVLTEPRNAVLKQYARLLEMEDVRLTLSEAALEAIVEKALTRNTGARALRSVIEKTMLEIMYRLPSLPEIREVEITPEVVRGEVNPTEFLAGLLQKKSA